MKSRLSLPTAATLSAQQRMIFDEVMRTRGNVQGPFLAWLLSPGLAGPAQALGAFCRYQTSLTLEESELLILLVAASYRCPAEQAIHEPIAVKAGLSVDVVTAIRQGDPVALPSPRLQILELCARELLAQRTLSESTFARAMEMLKPQTLVEVVGLMGYYAMVAYTLNAFDMRI